MSAVERQEPGGVGLRWGQAGDGEDGFVALLAGFQLRDSALDAADLRDMGKVEIIIERGASEQAALFQAPVALIDGLGTEGENAALCSGRTLRKINQLDHGLAK